MSIERNLAVSVLLTLLSGCVTGASPGSMEYMDIRPANYSEEYIHEIQFETEDGKHLALSTFNIKPFSQGGLGSSACCATLPGVGKRLRVLWMTGGDYYTPKSQWIGHSATARIKGVTSNDSDSNTSLILRFFQNNQIEAEYVPQSLKAGSPRNSRRDLLFTGQRVMRQVGE